MRIKDEYIRSAIGALETVRIVVDNKYSKEYKGYISALGASLIQSGLLPTVILYENSPSSKEDKSKLIAALIIILQDVFGYNHLKDKKPLSRFILASDAGVNRQLMKDIEKAAVALKLALRVFSTENEEEQL